MRTAPVLAMVLSIAAGTMMFQLAGVPGAFNAGNPAEDAQSGERLDSQLQEDNPLKQQEDESDGLIASAISAAEDTIVGFVIRGVGIMMSFVKFTALLPVELENLGVPRFAAYPVGLVMQVVSAVGIAQFMSGRVYT